MKNIVIIPAHNEEKYIEHTLRCIINQTHRPVELIIINDQSTDGTQSVLDQYCMNHSWIKSYLFPNKEKRAAGAKVVKVFQYGLTKISQPYDILTKLDADLTLPENYFEELTKMFEQDSQLGIAGGTILSEVNGKWVYENFSDQDHVKGAFKSYRKACFEHIGGLKPSIGWDTVDELLAMYHGWKTAVNSNLQIKHHRPLGTETGLVKIRYKIGIGLYRMRYGFIISSISALKTSVKIKPYLLSGLAVFAGWFVSWITQDAYMVSKEEGRFIRHFRYSRMRNKLTGLLK